MRLSWLESSLYSPSPYVLLANRRSSGSKTKHFSGRSAIATSWTSRLALGFEIGTFKSHSFTLALFLLASAWVQECGGALTVRIVYCPHAICTLPLPFPYFVQQPADHMQLDTRPSPSFFSHALKKIGEPGGEATNLPPSLRHIALRAWLWS